MPKPYPRGFRDDVVAVAVAVAGKGQVTVAQNVAARTASRQSKVTLLMKVDMHTIFPHARPAGPRRAIRPASRSRIRNRRQASVLRETRLT